MVRQGDDRWFNIVKWTVFAMINAEELGVTTANVKRLRETTNNPQIRRMLGREGRMGANLGLDADWVVRIIAQVGNYGESFARHLGPGSPLNIERGLNRLWSKGGILYAPPFR